MANLKTACLRTGASGSVRSKKKKTKKPEATEEKIASMADSQ
jgi:hypothetical protein